LTIILTKKTRSFDSHLLVNLTVVKQVNSTTSNPEKILQLFREKCRVLFQPTYTFDGILLKGRIPNFTFLQETDKTD